MAEKFKTMDGNTAAAHVAYAMSDMCSKFATVSLSDLLAALQKGT